MTMITLQIDQKDGVVGVGVSAGERDDLTISWLPDQDIMERIMSLFKALPRERQEKLLKILESLNQQLDMIEQSGAMV
jgi:hypothetical protein